MDWLLNNWENKTEYFAYALLSSAVIFYGIYSGLSVTHMTLDAFFLAVDVVVVDAVTSSLIFTLFLSFTGLLLLVELYSRKSVPSKYDSGEALAVIPVYKDGNVLENSINSLNSSNYENLRIVVVCEPGDKESIEASEELDCEVLMNKYPGSKAGAINTAFESYDADYFAIFDADEIISPEFVPHAVAHIEQGYDAFQGRRVPMPNGIVEGFAYCERVLFHTAYKLSELSGFRNLRSSSTVMTKDVWEKVGGYEDLLTEDLDFPHKCFREGINIRQDRRITNLMEAPHSWKDFWGQRKRWRMGQIEILHKALKGGYNNNFSYRGVVSLARLVFSVVVGFLLLAMVPKFLILFLLDANTIYLPPLAASVILTGLVSLRDYKDRGIEYIGLKAFFTPIVFAVTGFIAVKSLAEYVLSWDGEWYRVTKEE